MTPSDNLASPLDALDELEQLHAALRKDVETILKCPSNSTDGKPHELTIPDPRALSPFERRSAIRAMFALFEATTFRLKQAAAQAPGPSLLASSEHVLAREEAYDLTDKGEVQVRPARLRFLSNLQFAFRVFAKSRGATYSLPIDSPGWKALKESVTVRDRLTHPKTHRDLTVSDHEIRTAVEAYTWFIAQTLMVAVKVARALIATNQALKQRLAQAKAHIARTHGALPTLRPSRGRPDYIHLPQATKGNTEDPSTS